ncbi:response regulator [Gloeocapsa sp. PCC 73106]|uniref:response regulator n=1 Tax=Gloeocapsa sp. PCC 73106 TaxID=102232 RepID=UPI0002AC052A|nr:response regulator [Gloeocapsa sp. PCC 73106]ELR98017.1 response regulator with CheY-like receiver domain and winged-helix DNA-binding domain [Gloeocapsa sp. PCC 73106]
MRLLLVEDDPVLSDILIQSLQAWRYLVETAPDGQMGWEYIQSANYDLLLIDVGLPKLDGISLCQKLRSSGYTTPTILMTARNSPDQRVRGLDAGADDYLIKPINLEELQARLRALARRGQVSPSLVLTVGELRLNPKTCQVSYRDQPLYLTPKEYNLLELFMRNRERVFSKGQLLELLWTFDDSPLEETVKAHIKGLGQKLKKVGISEWIENVYGLGYRFNPQLISLQDKFKQEQEKLWRQYQGLMQQRLDVLAEVVGNLTPDTRRSGIQAAHKLAGVLGMLDREQGSVIAKQIEKLLDSEPDLEKLAVLTRELTEYLGLNVNLQPDLSQSTKFLLIASDLSLGQALTAIDAQWEQVYSLSQGRVWLEQKTPELVVLVLEKGETLELVGELSQRLPSIPVVVIASEDSLETRLAIAQSGAKSLLLQPVTPVEIWL